MRISLIVAMTPDRLIGRNGDLPWRLSDDLRRFKQLTTGHTILMGRRTYESIGRPLPGRKTIVVSRNAAFGRPGIAVAHDLTSAIELAATAHETELFVVGGSQIYELAMPVADRIYLTEVQARLAGDTYFPPWNRHPWQRTHTESTTADNRNEYPTEFQIWDRIHREDSRQESAAVP